MAFMMTTATNARGMITFRNDSFVDHIVVIVAVVIRGYWIF